MTIPKDSDLREALRRKYADTPQLPADFISRMHLASPDKPSRSMKRWLYPISAVAVAASLLLLVMLDIGQNQPKQNPVFAEEVTKPEHTVQETPQTITRTEVAAQPVATLAEEPKPAKKHRKAHKPALEEPVPQEAEPVQEEQENEYLPQQPDPFLLAAAETQNIRSRGERLFQKVNEIINNTNNTEQ